MSRLAGLAAELGEGALLTSEADIAVYSYDAALDRARPDGVVLARSAEDVRRAVAWCAKNGVPFVARGAGTNLSGGCIALRGGVVIALAGMNRVLEIDSEKGVAVVEPGCVNLSLQKALEPLGFFYAPDPASFKVSTLGGNVSENAGGPRCLKYGVTTNHVLALEVVLPDGSLEKFSLEDGGPQVASLIVGAEGTLGVVVRAWLKILPLPAVVRTLLAGFPSIQAAIDCVSAIIAAGALPRVLEALDRTTVESVEAYSHAGYPSTDAVLLIELDGDEASVARESELVEKLCREHRASDFRAAATQAERDKLWEGRRGAYAAMARLAPNVMVEDGVVPRDKLPEVVRRIEEICARHKLKVGLLFHAGDGNIHPNVAYDERNAEETERVKAAGREILQACVELGGSLSGEHGIGVDKRDAMAWLFTPETLELFRRLKRALDPAELANPDKLFPLPGASKGAPLKRPARRSLTDQARLLQDKLRAGSGAFRIAGASTRLPVPEGDALPVLSAAGLRSILDWDKKNYTLTVEAGIPPRELAERLAAEGFHARLPDAGGTLGGLLASGAWPGAREDLLGMTLLMADGSLAELGGKVVKNVAGYDVPRLVLGSWGAYGLILEVTLKLFSRRPDAGPFDAAPAPFAPSKVHRALKTAFDPGNRLNPWLFA